MRSRCVYTGLLIATIFCGLASRRYATQLPTLIGVYAGDALWAAMVFWFIAICFPRLSIWRIAIATCAVAAVVEASQLYHAPWIDSVRSTALGGLALGRGFVWSDLACYAVGVLGAAAIDFAILRFRHAE
jgi:hypothetical protein